MDFIVIYMTIYICLPQPLPHPILHPLPCLVLPSVYVINIVTLCCLPPFLPIRFLSLSPFYFHVTCTHVHTYKGVGNLDITCKWKCGICLLWVWLISLNKMTSSSIHFPANVRIVFFSIAGPSSTVFMYSVHQFICWWASEPVPHLGYYEHVVSLWYADSESFE